MGRSRLLRLYSALRESHVAAEQAPAAATMPGRALQPTVIQFGRLGDMVMLTSLLHLLRLRFGSPCLVVGAGPWNSVLYTGHPDVERVWSLSRHSPAAPGLTWWRVLAALRNSDPGPVYVCERQPRQLRRIRRLLFLAGVNPGRTAFIAHDLADVDVHWVDRLGRFGGRTPAALNSAAYPPPGSAGAPAPRLLVLDSDRSELRAWLNARGWATSPLVLIQPGNFRTMSRRRNYWRRRNDDKTWCGQSWAALLRKVHVAMPEALILLCGAPQERPMLRQIELAAAVPQVSVAELPLRRLLALCEHAHSMISVDTGPAHVAAALGLPLVVMYGAETPCHWLPRGESSPPVVAVGGPPRSVHVDQLSVEEVFAAWRSVTCCSGAIISALSAPAISCNDLPRRASTPPSTRARATGRATRPMRPSE